MRTAHGTARCPPSFNRVVEIGAAGTERRQTTVRMPVRHRHADDEDDDARVDGQFLVGARDPPPAASPPRSAPCALPAGTRCPPPPAPSLRSGFAVRPRARAAQGARDPLGARRRPRAVFQQMLIEALVLAAAGGAVGLLLARACLRAGATLLADQVPRADEISIDARVAALRRRRVDPDRHSRRRDAGAPRRPHRSQRRAEGRRAQRQRRRRPHAAAADRLRSGAVGRAADGRRRDAAQPAGAAPRRRRVRSAQRADDAGRAAGDAVQDAGADAARSSTARCSACARCPASRPRRWSTICRRRAARVQPIVLEGRAELLSRDQPTVAVRKIAPGYLRDDADSAGAGPRRRRRATSTCCSSAAARPSCCGATRIRSAAASRCRSSRRPIVKQVVGIVGDVKQGELSDAPMPTVYEYTRELPLARRSTLVAAHARCRRRRSRRPRPASCTRSIRSSRSRTSGRWRRCWTRR